MVLAKHRKQPKHRHRLSVVRAVQIPQLPIVTRWHIGDKKEGLNNA
jgi:hypothetical protein